MGVPSLSIKFRETGANKMNNDELKRGFDFDAMDDVDIGSHAITGKTQKRDASSDAQSKDDKNIEILFEKMEKEGDFPSFSKQITEINNILNLKYASAKDIADVIMRDFSLSNKLIKLVNSSFYGYFGRGGISSIEKAVIILGADQVQQAAASLMLFEHMQKNAYNNELKEMSLKTLMSGLIAKELAIDKGVPDSDEFLICAMFFRLGQNLMAYYHPERRESILQFAKRNTISDENAFRLFLGVSCQDLGVGIAKKWGLPDNIIHSMQTTKPEKPSLPAVTLSRSQLLGTAASFSNDLCDIRFQIRGREKRNSIITELLKIYRGRCDTDVDTIVEILNRVINNIRQNSFYLNINTEECRVLFDES
jgi:HD-like signal output (HDOD) protein